MNYCTLLNLMKEKNLSSAISLIAIFFDCILSLHIGAALGYIFGKITGCVCVEYFNPINLNLNEPISFSILPYSCALHGAIAGAVAAIMITILTISKHSQNDGKKEGGNDM